MPSWRSSPGSKAGTTRNASSPGWECAAQTNTKQRSTPTPPTSTPPSKLETTNRASNEPGDPQVSMVSFADPVVGGAGGGWPWLWRRMPGRACVVLARGGAAGLLEPAELGGGVDPQFLGQQVPSPTE